MAAEQAQMDATFHFIMKHFVDKGQPPHYTEVAKALGVSMEEGRKALHALFSAGVYGWALPRYGLYRLLRSLQQPTYPGSDHYRRRAKMVRPVSIRVAGGLPAFPRQSGPNRHTVPGLRGTDPGSDARRRVGGGRPGRDHRVRGGSPGGVDERPGLCLKHHDFLPVGRTSSEMGTIRSGYGGGYSDIG